MDEPRAVRARDRRNSWCPACAAGRGVLFTSINNDGEEALAWRCPTCAHLWAVEPRDAIVHERVEPPEHSPGA
jgi:hypothetical protein